MPRLTFIFRTDVHVADRGPASWKGDYAAEIWSNLQQVGEYARTYNATAVLDGGDYFHVKAATRNPHALVEKSARIHAEYPCPTYSIEGNHDIAYNNLDSVTRQPIGVLYATGVFKHLREEVFEGAGVRVRVVGVPYSPFRTVDELRAIRKQPGDTYLIAIVHQLAGADPPPSVEDFFNEPVFRYTDLIVEGGPDVWCFPPETPVLDALYRPIPIETVQEGFAVAGRSGPAIVEAAHPVRQVSEGLVRLDIEGVPPLVPGATSEHPYWVAKGLQCVLPSRSTRRCHVQATWTKAGLIAVGDYVAIPVPQIPQGASSELGLARLLGYYAAEGHILTNHNGEPATGVAWSFHENDTKLHEDVRALVKEHFDLDTYTHQGGTGACTQVCAYGAEIARFFTEQGGRYSDQKSLSTWIWEQSAAARTEFLIGWLLGGGRARKTRADVGGATLSRALAFQTFFLALSVGLRPYFTVRPTSDDSRQTCHIISFYGDDAELLSHRLGVQPPERSKNKVAGFFSDGLYYARVREVSRVAYEGPVHNFRTSTGEYVAGGVLVHNCFGHWHKDQGIVEIDGRYFVNQGALSRGALIRENLQRTPKVALIDMGATRFDVVPLEMRVAPAEDVFDLERKERQEKEGVEIDQFVSKLCANAEFDPMLGIETNLQSLDFARDVRDLALEYLERARAEAG
jgi:hypothetical protein